ncbi:MAG: hypothetical protein WAN17_18900 [Candidatus Sulfotelmatobacter sp.]
MEALTRLVADSLARHGFDPPVDPRRLQWSRWFRCDSTHSLLVVPSKPGIFALAEEIMDLGPSNASGVSKTQVGTAAPAVGNSDVGTDVFVRPASAPTPEGSTDREGHDFSRAARSPENSPALAAAGIAVGTHRTDIPRRMLAVLQFSEDDDMAFTLDRMFTCPNPMRARLASGRCFLRFVVIEDQTQRRNICNALNQWMHSSAEKASGFGVDFQSSLEFTDGPGTTRVGRTLLSDNANSARTPAHTTETGPKTDFATPAPNLDSGANKNLHCPHPLPSGF